MLGITINAEFSTNSRVQELLNLLVQVVPRRTVVVQEELVFRMGVLVDASLAKHRIEAPPAELEVRWMVPHPGLKVSDE